MTKKLKVYFSITAVAILSISIALSVSAFAGNQVSKLTASPQSYDLTLNASNAPQGLTSSFQESVTATATTNLGNDITFVVTNAKSLDGGYVLLGNHGSVYCCTDDNHHISGLATIKVTFTGGTLKLLSSSVQTTDGSSYITEEATLTSGTAHDLTTPANSFVLQAQDSNISITQIDLSYSCVPSSSSYDFDKKYNVENFESYTATGVGYDSSHGVGVTTNLRASLYSTYYGAGTNPLDGSGWTVMGSSDYVTYLSNKGVDGTKCALLKSNSGNYFSYIQSKHFFGVPTAIGKGAKLSVMLHGAYTSTSAGTESDYKATVTLIAYYNKQLNKSGVNDGVTAKYEVTPHSPWGEYTLDLDPTKTIYAFGIHIAKASGTIYVPIDNVSIYTDFEYTNWPKGAYMENVSIMGVSMSTIFAFSDDQKTVDVRFANNTKPGITGYTYNESTKQFSITTNGNYSGRTYGTITGTYDPTNNRLTKVGLSGTIGGNVSNNGSLTIPATAKYWDCDGSTSELQTVFKRRYGGTVDTINADKITSAPYNRVSGTNSMKIRLWTGGLTQLNLQNDISQTCKNIGFWVYSTFSDVKTIRLWTYTGANLTSNEEVGSVETVPNQWAFVCMGFGQRTLRNFQIAFDKYDPNQGMILIDDICLYK